MGSETVMNPMSRMSRQSEPAIYALSRGRSILTRNQRSRPLGAVTPPTPLPSRYISMIGCQDRCPDMP